MKRNLRIVFFILAFFAFLYAIIFPILTLDTLVRVFSRAQALETRNLFLLLFLEGSRLVTSIVGIALALILILRASDRADARALAMFLLFATITYEKLLGGSAYPGYGQERATMALLQAGLSPRLLSAAFGPNAWTLWAALAALLRFSAVFPRPIETGTLEASGTKDRRGMLRGSAVAGSDVGAAFRNVSMALQRKGVYRSTVLAATASGMIVLHLLLGPGLVIAATAFVIGIVITNVRASFMTAEGTDRVRGIWITEGFLLALFMFLIGAAVFVVPRPDARMLGFLVVMLIPATVMACLALAVLDHGELDTGDLIESTARTGTFLLGLLLGFGLLLRFFLFAGRAVHLAPAAAFFAAAAVAALAAIPLRNALERLRLRLLERTQEAR